jgi:hypothetical protein
MMSYLPSRSFNDREGLQVESPGLEIWSQARQENENVSRTQQDYVPLATNNTTIRKRQICGLRQTTFFLLVVIVCIVIAVVIGGGVGGSIAANKYV